MNFQQLQDIDRKQKTLLTSIQSNLYNISPLVTSFLNKQSLGGAAGSSNLNGATLDCVPNDSLPAAGGEQGFDHAGCSNNSPEPPLLGYRIEQVAKDMKYQEQQQVQVRQQMQPQAQAQAPPGQTQVEVVKVELPTTTVNKAQTANGPPKNNLMQLQMLLKNYK